MTKEEWKQVEEALQSIFRTVKLKIDSYEVVLRLERITQFKNAIMVYVDGKFSFEWAIEDCEIRKRFFQKKTHSLINGKDKASMMKGLSKKQKDDFEQRNKYHTYYPYWTSFRSLKKHLIANNENIELLEIK